MKKLLIIFLFLLTGCATSSKNFLKKMSKEYEKIDSYSVTGNIEINHTDSKTNYSFETSSLNENLKVTLTNNQTNTKQTIIKNNKGVFVLSPLTNKTYRFPSDWPSKSSTPYILQTIVNDVLNDENVEVIENDLDFVLKCELKNNINLNLGKEEIHFNKKSLLPTNLIIFDKNNNEKIRVTFDEFNLKPNLTDDDFLTEPNMTSLILEIGEGFEEREFSLPTYNPYNTTISQKTLDDAIIVSYTGDKDYVIYQCNSSCLEDNAVFGTYDDIVLLNEGIGYVRDNVLKWCFGGIEYSIYSDSLEVYEMIDIANSIV